MTHNWKKSIIYIYNSEDHLHKSSLEWQDKPRRRWGSADARLWMMVPKALFSEWGRRKKKSQSRLHSPTPWLCNSPNQTNLLHSTMVRFAMWHKKHKRFPAFGFPQVSLLKHEPKTLQEEISKALVWVRSLNNPSCRTARMAVNKVQCKSTMNPAETHTKQRNNTLILGYGKHFWHVSLKKKERKWCHFSPLSPHFKGHTEVTAFWERHSADRDDASLWGELSSRDEHTTLAKFHYSYKSEVAEFVVCKITCHKIYKWVSLISFDVLVQLSRVGVSSSSRSELWAHCWSCFRQLDNKNSW